MRSLDDRAQLVLDDWARAARRRGAPQSLRNPRRMLRLPPEHQIQQGADRGKARTRQSITLRVRK